jgi:transcription initiation factor TFIIIB Brf1 subunit/transcription initiation factor TFIIB
MICIDCKSNDIRQDEKSGETYCFGCGYVIDENPLEEYVFGNDNYDKHSEIGGLGSFISLTDSRGKKDFSKMGRLLRKNHNRTVHKSKGIIQRGVIGCNMLGGELGVTKALREQMAFNYRVMVRNRITTGFPLDARVAATVFFTLKDNNIPITLYEIIQHNGAHMGLSSKLAKRVACMFGRPFVLGRINIIEDIERYGNKLGLTRESLKISLDVGIPLYNMAKERCLTLTSGLIAGIIYATQLLNPTQNTSQKAVGRAVMVSDLTVRINSNKVIDMLNYSKKEWVNTTPDKVLNGMRDKK